MREIAAGRAVPAEASTSGSGLEQIDRLKATILILSLYNDNFFDVPAVVVIHPGWRIDWIKRTEKTSEPKYQVTEKEWSRFERFLRAAERAICSIPGLDLYPRFYVAAERYLRATFSTGHSFFSELRLDTHTWDEITGEEVIVGERHPDERSLQEDVLLNYVIGLEVLVGTQDDRTARNRGARLARRVASLIARDGPEENWVCNFVTNVFADRNNLVHESQGAQTQDLRVLRRVFQRALGMAITLSAAAKNLNELEEIVISDPKKVLSRRRRVDHAREELFRLIADCSRLDQWKSPVQDWR